MPSLVAVRTSQPFLALSISRYSYTFIDIPSSVAKPSAPDLPFKIAPARGRPFEGGWKGLPTTRRVLDASARVLGCHGASKLLATARRCTQQCSTYVLDSHGNNVCHWHALGMRLACDRIVSRPNRYIRVTRDVARESTHAG